MLNTWSRRIQSAVASAGVGLGIVLAAAGLGVASDAAQARQVVIQEFQNANGDGYFAERQVFRAARLLMPQDQLLLELRPTADTARYEVYFHNAHSVAEGAGEYLGQLQMTALTAVPRAALVEMVGLPQADLMAGMRVAAMAGFIHAEEASVPVFGTVSQTYMKPESGLEGIAWLGLHGTRTAVAACEAAHSGLAGDLSGRALEVWVNAGFPPAELANVDGVPFDVPVPTPSRRKDIFTHSPLPETERCCNSYGLALLGDSGPATGGNIGSSFCCDIRCSSCEPPLDVCITQDPGWIVRLNEVGIRAGITQYYEVKKDGEFDFVQPAEPPLDPKCKTWWKRVHYRVILHQILPHKVLIGLPSNIVRSDLYRCTASVSCACP